MPDGFAILSPDLRALSEEIGQALGSTYMDRARSAAQPAEIVDWADGRGARARRLALRRGLPFRPVSVGPLNAVRPEPAARPLSLVLGRRSDAAPHPGATSAADGLALWRHLRLSWRNDGRDRLPDALAGARFTLLVVGQSPAAAAFEELVRAAGSGAAGRIACLADSRMPANLADAAAGRGGDMVAVRMTNPHALFDHAEIVYAPAGSELGRDAALSGVPVAQADGTSTSAGSREAHEAAFQRAFLDGVVYLDPWRPCLTSFAAAAENLAWLRDRFHENDGTTVCVGISRWKRRQVAVFLDGPDGPPRFVASPGRAAAEAARTGGRVVAWDTRMPAALPDACAAAHVPLSRMEDGFLRSVGLGAAFRPGASAVLDRSGIYYDPGHRSDLETILGETEFEPALLERARHLRRQIVDLRLSKYNVGAPAADGILAGLPRDRTVVLVPGQVEDDASVLLGSPCVRTNLDLLAASRAANPGAFLLFKPHPDVAAGLRRGRVADTDAQRHADLVVTDISIADLLDRVDAVETMTSLTGFEALLRGRAVATHGQPFYAGWGLTHDRSPPAGRGRRLTLDELVAGALIAYPRYLDPVSGLRCSPELLVERLSEARRTAEAEPAAGVTVRALYVRARYALLGPLASALRRARGGRTRHPAEPDA